MLKKFFHIDYFLLISVLALVLMGIFVLAGVSADFSLNMLGTSTHYLFHQLFWAFGIGFVLAFVAFRIPLSFFKKWAWLLILVNLFFMVLVFIPGLTVFVGGAPRWIDFGLFTLQPSEFLKLTFIIYLSAFLSERSKKGKRKEKKDWFWKITLLPFAIILLLIFLLLYFQSDASTLFLIAGIACLVYFVSGMPLWHLFMLGLIVLGGSAFIVFEPYRLNRILVFLGFIQDPMRVGYQINQALISVGSGGIFGLGPGMSGQKIGGFLPQTMSDSIFAVFGEEMGFVGCFALVVLFLLFLWRSFKLAKKSRDKFSQLFSLGFCSWICIQAFINMGAIIGLLPLTGIPLPFISYGGSHIIAELIGVGILLNISKSIKR